MKLSVVQQAIVNLALFRKQMGSRLSLEAVERIWSNIGVKQARGLKETYQRHGLFSEKIFRDSSVSYEKYRYARRNYKKFLIFDWVKFIAVSGSVAAEIAKVEDDIDIFIVIKNDRVWIYRFLLKLKNLGRGILRFAHNNDVKNRFCVNFICEERGIRSFPQDIFVFHEIFMMKPIFNPAYFYEILAQNSWLQSYGVEIEDVLRSKQGNSFFMRGIDTLFMFPQLLFMILMNRRPNISQYIKNTLKGKFISYPKSFKPAVMQNFYDSQTRFEEENAVTLTQSDPIAQ